MEKKKKRRNTWPILLQERRQENEKEQYKYGVRCFYISNNGRRNTWSQSSQITDECSLGQRLPSYPNNDENCFRVKAYFKKIKKKISSKVKYIKHKLLPITRLLPVIFAVASIVLNVSDVSTDGLSTQRICTAQCACEYIEAKDHGCDVPGDICSSAVIDGVLARHYCRDVGANKTACLKKSPWPVPEGCKCYWDETWLRYNGAGCLAPDGHCWYLKPDGQHSNDYCKINGGYSSENCKKLPEFENPYSNKLQIRHSFWCTVSIGTIAGPSIINNLILLYSLLHWSNYRRYFSLAGLPSFSEIAYPAIVCIFIVLATLQLLPYLCLLLKLLTVWRIYMKTIDEDNNSEDLKYLTLKMMIIFTFTEDIPQITLQTVFFVRASLGNEDGILDALSWVAVAGLVTSCLSLSKNYTEYVSAKDSEISAPFTFSTVFIAAGGRMMVFCLMVTGAEPVITIMITTVSLVFGSCSKCEECQDLCPNQPLELPETIELPVVNNDIQNISTHAETKWEKLLYVPYKAVRGIQLALILIILDGQTLNGLWTSACFALCAAMLYADEGPTANYEEIRKTALIFVLMSYTINSITVLIKGQNRIQGLLVTMVFFLNFLILHNYSSILIPILSVAVTFITANFISFINSKRKSQNDVIEDLA